MGTEEEMRGYRESVGQQEWRTELSDLQRARHPSGDGHLTVGLKIWCSEKWMGLGVLSVYQHIGSN